ncbi:hypothetical protein OHS71_29465 [Streptomyces sp. NBC_00377]|uniref:hypothetical protein n=1 Tax=unclassified Streptomyces TaxID=2593676 RepID=UPI002E1D49B5|nr:MULTISPECIES: hypothetical protein [unclassified Streptomyces]
MGTVVLSGAVVLVVLGFGNPLYWLAAAGVLFLYVRYGLGSSAPSAGSTGPAPSAAPAPTTYKAYRDRRDKQAKWERRYRRERPMESRRQERERGK